MPEENLNNSNGKLNSLEQNVQDLIEIVGHISENMSTKDDINKINNELTSIHGTLRLIRLEIDEVKRELERVSKRTIEDADAAAGDILELRSRVEKLEAWVKQMQAAPAGIR